MFDPNSRYYALETVRLTMTDSDGQQRMLAYKRRRFIPSSDGMVTMVEHKVFQGDRLDNVTAHYLGDPLQFWRICDANEKLYPADLTEEVGTTIRIGMPKIG